jgi:hypothetical protein
MFTLGIEVYTAPTNDKGTKLLEENRYDILMTDLNQTPQGSTIKEVPTYQTPTSQS